MTEQEIDQMEAGPELDALVAEKVMGWPVIGPNDPYSQYLDKGGVIYNGLAQKFPKFGVIPSNWSPSTDIAAAWQVLEAMFQKAYSPNYDLPLVYRCAEGFWNCEVLIPGGNGLGTDPDSNVATGEADTAPLAICRAALKSTLQRAG
jgi:hypothetical protein